jgi:putative phosphoribosyl transferase
MPSASIDEVVRIRAGMAMLDADLIVPDDAFGLVVFAHGSGSSRFSRRNRAVAAFIRNSGLGTLLLDLLTREEEAIDEETRGYRFDIELLGRRPTLRATHSSACRLLRSSSLAATTRSSSI